jgi:hypothetical protein
MTATPERGVGRTLFMLQGSYKLNMWLIYTTAGLIHRTFNNAVSTAEIVEVLFKQGSRWVVAVHPTDGDIEIEL